MRRYKIPLPRQYWVQFALMVLCIAAMFGGIFLMGSLSGWKELEDFSGEERRYFKLFLLFEAVVMAFEFFFAFRCGKIWNENERESARMLDYAGLKPGDWDHVWFSADQMYRALVMKKRDKYVLHVQRFFYREFAAKNEFGWEDVGGRVQYASLEAAQEALAAQYSFLF